MQSGVGQLKPLFYAFTIAWACLAQSVCAQPRLTVESSLVWTDSAKWFGGFSGAEISTDGTILTLITDRGNVARAQLHRAVGKIKGVELRWHQSIRDANEVPLKPQFRDTEGLAISADGQAYVSSETRVHVIKLDLLTGKTVPLPTHPDFALLRKNKGLEALAIHPDGRIFTLSESRGGQSGTTPITVFSDGQWKVTHRLPLSGPFRPVGADFDSAGRLYLLERTLSPLGFRSRIRRIDLNRNPVIAETLMTTSPGVFDNLEALTVWTDKSGATRLVLISDDNFLPVQVTQIVELLLTE